MGQGDELRILVFGLAVVGVYAGAGWILFRRVRSRLRREPGASSRLGRTCGTTVLALAVLGIGCAAWGFFVEPNRLTVTRVRMESARVPRGAAPIRIVHITDLHCESVPRLEEQLPEAIAKERPDLIAFTGDSLNTPAGLPVFQRCMSRIASIAPTFVVKGNWDIWNVPGIERFADTGVHELDGTAARVTVRGTDVWIAGVPADQEALGGHALAGVPHGVPTIFLFHHPYPEVVPDVDRSRVDLLLAGHLHGGQVALPLFGAIMTLSRHGKRYEHGLYEVGPMHLFVSRGIGMEGGRAPRIRFCAPPEIAVIEIISADDPRGGAGER